MKTAKNAAVENAFVENIVQPIDNRDLLERMLWNNGERCSLLSVAQLDELFLSEWPRKWLQSIAPYGNVKRTMLVYTLKNAQVPTVNVKFYTENNEYTILMVGRESDGGKKHGYLGCVLRNRKERPGELWKRGCDLPDGTFEEKTWERIKCAIIAHEIKNLQIEL